MKTMIIYTSTYGYTKECVEKLKENINGEVIVINAEKDMIPSTAEYENIIVGGSIYMGQIHKKLKSYLTQNSNELLKKRVAFFLSCGLPENFDETVKNCFPKDLLEKAIDIECFGGELRKDKMNFGHKMITGIMEKAAANKSDVLKMPENIRKLAESINN